MPFAVVRLENKNEIILKISGSLDESASLPAEPTAHIIRIELSKLRGISSIGIRNFIFWGDKHQAVQAIRLESCPSIFVKNFSLIAGFLKPNMTLISFYVPFYSSITKEHVDVLFMREREFYPDGRYKIPEIKDSRGNPMEIDVNAKTYFSFLKK